MERRDEEIEVLRREVRRLRLIVPEEEREVSREFTGQEGEEGGEGGASGISPG